MIAERVLKRVRQDLDYGESKEKLFAEIWLGRGIDRSLVKGPVLSVPYGSTCQGSGGHAA